MRVKKQPYVKDFYSSIVSALEKGSYPAQIARNLNISKQNLNYYIKKLKDKGLIEKMPGLTSWRVKKSTSGRVKKTTRVGKEITDPLKPDIVRGHAFQFKLSLPKNLKNWDKREQIFKKLNLKFYPLKLFGGGQGIIYKNHKIHLTNRSIIIYNSENESFFAGISQVAHDTALNYYLSIIKSLERDLKANFSEFGKYKFRVTRQHYALIKNALAEQYNENKEKLHVTNERGEWFIIDNSFNLNEAETIHPKTAVKDNAIIQNFFNSLKQNPITTGEILNEFKENKGLIKELSKQQVLLSDLISQMNGNLFKITKYIYGSQRKSES